MYVAEDGSEANRIFQIPTEEDDLCRRIEMFHASSIVAQVTGVYMALLSAKDAVAAINPAYAANIEAVYKYARAHDLRAAEVITDPKGDRKRRANEQDDADLYLRIVSRNAEGIIVRGAKLHITGASLCHELVVLLAGKLDETRAAMAKLWCTELEGRVLDKCLQFFGGYGYMWEYPIARAYADARIRRILAGSNEIMKELVARSI